MRRRVCRTCGRETVKELTAEGPKFFCKTCNGYPSYDEFDEDPHCPQCGDPVEVCVKCASGFFCNRCGCLLSRKDIVWREKES